MEATAHPWATEARPGFTDADAVTRLGLILLATDLTTEADMARLVPVADARLHATRLAYDNPTTPQNLRRMAPRLAKAAALLAPGAPLAAVCFACTSASVVIGEDAVCDAVREGRPGAAVVTPIGAGMRALAAFGARCIAVLAPYLPDTLAPMLAHFAASGFDVVRARCMGIGDDRDMARVDAATIVAAAREADAPQAEALFIACTALPALAVVDAVEAALGKPVVTANQACGWEMRRHAGLTAPLSGFGRLLAQATP